MRKLLVLASFIIFPSISIASELSATRTIAGIEFGHDTPAIFSEKMLSQGGHLASYEWGEIPPDEAFPLNHLRVEAILSNGLKESAYVEKVKANFLESGEIYSLTLYFSGGNILQRIRQGILEKYPAKKNLNEYQKNNWNKSNAFTMLNCNVWLQDGNLDVCMTDAYVVNHYDEYTPKCITAIKDNGEACQRKFSAHYSINSLYKKRDREIAERKKQFNDEQARLSKSISEAL